MNKKIARGVHHGPELNEEMDFFNSQEKGVFSFFLLLVSLL